MHNRRISVARRRGLSELKSKLSSRSGFTHIEFRGETTACVGRPAASLPAT